MENLMQNLMQKTWVSWTILSLTALLVAGCDVAPSKYGEDESIYRKGLELLELYQSVEGVYVGQLTRPLPGGGVESFPVEIRLQAIANFEGRTNSGRLISKPDLIGQYRRLDLVGPLDHVFYKAEFERNTGLLQMVYSDPNTGARVAVKGFFRGENIEQGEVRTRAGRLGDLNLQRISREVFAPREGEEDERRERQADLYREVLGTFRGLARDAGGEPFPLHIQIYLVDEPSTGGPGGESYEVKLKARIHRPDYNDVTLDRWADVQYNLESRQINIFTPQTGGGAIPGAGFFSASGEFNPESGELILHRMSDHRGPMGRWRGARHISA